MANNALGDLTPARKARPRDYDYLALALFAIVVVLACLFSGLIRAKVPERLPVCAPVPYHVGQRPTCIIVPREAP